MSVGCRQLTFALDNLIGYSRAHHGVWTTKRCPLWYWIWWRKPSWTSLLSGIVQTTPTRQQLLDVLVFLASTQYLCIISVPSNCRIELSFFHLNSRARLIVGLSKPTIFIRVNPFPLLRQAFFFTSQNSLYLNVYEYQKSFIFPFFSTSIIPKLVASL